jgi:hypothetical protein
MNEAQQEINGNGLGLKKVGRAVRKVGRVAMKSGVADFIIDEAVGTLPIQAIAKRAVASVVKQQVRQFTGAGINQIDLQNNPYIPKITKLWCPHNDASDIVPLDSDAYHPTAHMSNASFNPVNYSYRK